MFLILTTIYKKKGENIHLYFKFIKFIQLLTVSGRVPNVDISKRQIQKRIAKIQNIKVFKLKLMDKNNLNFKLSIKVF